MTSNIAEAIIPRSKILKLLNKHNVRWQSWGEGTSRTLNDLLTYHERDRLYFRDSRSNVTIDVHAAVVIITYEQKHRCLELYEDRQVFGNSEVLRRASFNGIAETAKRQETFRQSAERCLAEELSFRDPSQYELSECLKVEDRDPVPSEKWPGIFAAYHRHIFECVISRGLFRAKGYKEVENGRTIYFKWKPRGQFQFRI